jgi:4-diphosphocytidyl-2-C-methyl-D-erythritol kinase
MCLHKVIPMGSGLGGGSSDGAFTLKMVNELFALGLSNQDLMNYAKVLGSDCAFFIENQPQFAHGKGDLLESVEIDLSGLFIVIVIPDIHVVTAEAYQMVTPKQPNHSIKEIIQYPIPEWKNFLVNDFENPVLAKHPVIGGIKQQLYDAGALFAALSGSGSAVYGLFSENPKFNSVFMKGNALYSGYL